METQRWAELWGAIGAAQEMGETVHEACQTGRSSTRVLLLVTVVLGSLLAYVIPASASHPEVSLPGSNFEIDTDANLKVDDPTPSTDWAGLTEIRKADTTSGPTDESFGQGTKEDTAVPTMVDGSIPPNKSDLKFFGLYQEGGSTSGFLNLYWSRVQEPQGTTNMDFEFNQKRAAAGQGNGVTPCARPGTCWSSMTWPRAAHARSCRSGSGPAAPGVRPPT